MKNGDYGRFRYVEGDLVELAKNREFDVIIHGCNCFCTMNSGIARAIRNAWPNVYYEADLRTTSGDRDKLGTYTSYVTPQGTHVLNAYTQYNYGRDGKVYLKYWALRNALKSIKTDYGMGGGVWNKFGLPQIGCGLAGGDWSKVEQIIKEELYNEDVTVVLYKP